jgi:DNA-binding GntR family transcriptional regulator
MYDNILKLVIHNEVPIDSLLVESRLVEMFNVSRAPVREALIELCNDNILHNIPRAGYQIVRISPKEMRDAFQLRQVLEIEGLRIGWDRLTEKDLKELTELARESDKARLDGVKSDTLNAKMRLNMQFHLRINELSGNALMTGTLKSTINLLMRGLAQIMSKENEMPVPKRTYHSGIVEAFAKKSLENAIDYLRTDIVDQEKVMWGL